MLSIANFQVFNRNSHENPTPCNTTKWIMGRIWFLNFQLPSSHYCLLSIYCVWSSCLLQCNISYHFTLFLSLTTSQQRSVSSFKAKKYLSSLFLGLCSRMVRRTCHLRNPLHVLAKYRRWLLRWQGKTVRQNCWICQQKHRMG